MEFMCSALQVEVLWTVYSCTEAPNTILPSVIPNRPTFTACSSVFCFYKLCVYVAPKSFNQPSLIFECFVCVPDWIGGNCCK